MKKTSEKKLRVLVTIAAPAMGGTENQLLAFLQRYDRSKFVVDVVCGTSTDGPLRDKYLATETRLILCQWTKYVIPFIWRLLRLLRRERYNVLHTRAAEASGAAILAARIAGVPTRIASYHHTETYWRNPGPINRLAVGILQWMTRRWATKILGVSESCLDVYHPHWKKHPERFQVCYNGVDIEQFSKTVNPHEIRRELGLPKDSQVVGHVGSFRKAKNHQTFVDIAERVSKHFENAYFLLVGDGQLRQKIELEVTKRGLAKRFVFAGNRLDVAHMYVMMDVFVMPSLNEGFPSVVIEAQLSGLPVVASDIASIREALSPAMHKFCRPPLDSAGMAEQVISLLENPELTRKLGREGREYVAEKFSIDRTVRQLESLYKTTNTSNR